MRKAVHRYRHEGFKPSALPKAGRIDSGHFTVYKAAGIRRVDPTHWWRGGRVAEGGGLLNRYTVNSRIVGSNPIPSAISAFAAVLTHPINLCIRRVFCLVASAVVRYDPT